MYSEISCIYKITSPSGKIYIGQTVNLRNRVRKYKGMFFKGQLKLWNNCQKYNWQPLDTLSVIEECPIDKLNEREIFWISFYDAYHTGLNCDEGGSGRKGYKPSQETKEKLRKANLGNKHSEETKVKISESLKGISKEERSSWKTNKGVPLTQDHIAKIKKTKKDNPFKMSDAQRKQVSENNLGNTYRLGKTHNDETKKKISESKKGVNSTYRDKKIFNVTTGDIYASQREAAEKLETRSANILRACNGERKSCKGFILKYFEDVFNEEKDSDPIGCGDICGKWD